MPVEHLGTLLFTIRTYKEVIARSVAGHGRPVTRLAQYERGISIPGPADFWKVWSYLSSDPPPPSGTP
jgi:hypothetical protein